MTTERKSTDERKDMIGRQVSMMAAQGMRVESQSDFQAILVKGKRVNHVLHLILTIITFGIWGIVWLALHVLGGETRHIVTVDEFGNVISSEA